MKVDPMVLAGVARLVESTVNKALQYDPGTRASLRQLEDRTLCVESTQPEFSLFVTAWDGNVRVQIASDQPPEATLRGNLVQLATLPHRDLHNLHETGIELHGNFHLVQQWQRVLNDLDIDWEEPLNRMVGELVGHPLAQSLRAIAQKLRHDGEKVPRYLAEYLTEEARVLIGEDEAEVFYQDVDDLRSRIDRLEARIQRLEARSIPQLEPPPPTPILPPPNTGE